MNIINQVTLRNLKENKRRTLVTMIGVIISVAMITAVSTLGVSFLDLLAREHIATNGEWHIQYKNVTSEQIEALERELTPESIVLASDGYAALEQSVNEFKPYLYFQNYNEAGMEQFPIDVVEGRLPQNENEIAISETIENNANVNYQIGDQLTVQIGKRVSKMDGTTLVQNNSLLREDETIMEELRINEKKTLTVVGTIERPSWEPAWAPGYTVIGYVDESALSENRSVDAFVVLSDIKGSLFERAEAFAQTYGIEKVNFNNELLRFYGVTKNDNLRMTMFSLVSIIMAIIIIGSVALIYNAFAISVSERARHLGMLSSVGATKKQKRNSVFFEGAVIASISIPVGIVAGFAGIGTTFAYINTFLQEALHTTEALEVVVTPSSIITACLISIATIFISTYVPAQRASKVSAIDAIRQTDDIKLTKKAVKTSKLIRKLFGIEAEIGLKNMKRNKKRYVATLLSLIVSIVLFLSVSYFTDSLKKSLELTKDDFQFDIQISSNQLAQEELNAYTKLDYVTSSTVIEEIRLETLVSIKNVAPPLKKQIEENDFALENGVFPYYVVLQSLDEESFHAYAKEIGVNPEEYMVQKSPLAIVVDQISYEDEASGKIVQTKAIETKVGDTLDLYMIPEDNGGHEQIDREFITTVEVGALTDKTPLGTQAALLGGIHIIVPQSTMDKLELDGKPFVYLNSSDPLATQAAIESLNDMNVYIYNVYQRRQQEEQMIMIMSIFIYGFITLISFILIANIFNTISTSIGLRKREFAMLRSVGMTPKGFNKMIRYESLFYGLKALGYGLPLSILTMLTIHRSVGYTFDYGFQLPWRAILFVVIMIFVIVGSAMLYSISKMKKENIIESLKQENI